MIWCEILEGSVKRRGESTHCNPPPKKIHTSDPRKMIILQKNPILRSSHPPIIHCIRPILHPPIRAPHPISQIPKIRPPPKKIHTSEPRKMIILQKSPILRSSRPPIIHCIRPMLHPPTRAPQPITEIPKIPPPEKIQTSEPRKMIILQNGHILRSSHPP